MPFPAVHGKAAETQIGSHGIPESAYRTQGPTRTEKEYRGQVLQTSAFAPKALLLNTAAENCPRADGRGRGQTRPSNQHCCPEFVQIDATFVVILGSNAFPISPLTSSSSSCRCSPLPLPTVRVPANKLPAPPSGFLPRVHLRRTLFQSVYCPPAFDDAVSFTSPTERDFERRRMRVLSFHCCCNTRFVESCDCVFLSMFALFPLSQNRFPFPCSS